MIFLLKIKNKGWVDVDLKIFTTEMMCWRFEKALNLCAEGFHWGQLRADGRKYITHPIKLCQILVYFGIIDEDTLIAAIFHDAPESSSVKILEEIEAYGCDVVFLVTLLTRTPPDEDFEFYCARILQDYRAVLIKLADRLHNLRNMTKRIHTGKFFTKKRLKEQVRETVKCIIPMAESAMELFPEHSEKIREMLDEIEFAVKMAKLVCD
ncbi:MAG: hypothetical protein ACD_11C00057G0012 [uncultured bacterium]|nr:MAG: hypothetical protein ACD_11C00057G0012 [uncultured bacterium]